MRDQKAIEYDGVVSPLRDEPSAFKRQCFRDGWDAAIAALPDRVQLEWKVGQFKCNDGLIYTSRAFSPFGTYYAYERTWYGPGIVVAHGSDESDCQQRANADYTRRILSAFGITGET